MEAIILAGGFGTRLSHIVTDVPKPMALVAGKPFLEYILEVLSQNGITKVVMAVGYKSEVIINHFGTKYKNIAIRYSVESKPLFTGGAIKLALKSCLDDDVFIINGDTFFNVDLMQLKEFHKLNKADLTISTKLMRQFERYGTIESFELKITTFREKCRVDEGWINGGIYLIKRDLLESISDEVFSFETDFMEKKTEQLNIFEFKSSAYFIDIGIPEDYYKAQNDFVRGVFNE